MILMGCLKNLTVALTSLTLILLANTALSQTKEALDVSWEWRDPPPFRLGLSSTVSVTIRNVSNATAELKSVGLRFTWMEKGVFYYGGGSDQNRTLAPGESVTYDIGFNIQEIVWLAGKHQAVILIAYDYQIEGKWANPPAIAYLLDVEIIGDGGTQNVDGGAQITMTTTVFIITIVGLIVWLGRGRIAPLLKRISKLAGNKLHSLSYQTKISVK